MSVEVIFGCRGSGKSYYSGSVMENKIVSTNLNFVIFDYHSEHLGLATLSNAKIMVLEEKHIGKVDWLEVLKKNPQILITNYKVDRDSLNEEFDTICNLILEIEDRFTMIDEIQNLACLHNCSEGLKKLICEGRKFNCGLMGISQRPALVNKLLISQASKLTCFHLHERNDLMAIKGYFPNCEQLIKLKRFIGLEYDTQSAEVNQVIAGQRVTKHYG